MASITYEASEAAEDRIREATILSSSARTTSGDTYSSPLDASYFREGIFFLDVTNASGADATMEVKIQTKDSLSDKWYDVLTFDFVTGEMSQARAVSHGLGRSLACKYTIEGTNPSFTFSVGAILKK